MTEKHHYWGKTYFCISSPETPGIEGTSTMALDPLSRGSVITVLTPSSAAQWILVKSEEKQL